MSVGRLKSTWENLGRVDPLWAVLSDPSRRHGGWEVEEFMATGHGQVAMIEGLLRDHGLALGGRVLDFGCGVGRLSNALAERGAQVVGVDIAASMVEQATRLCRHPDSIRFVSYDGRLLPFGDGEFDTAVSLIVLQHAHPAVQLACLLELQRVVRIGGVLVLQIPSRPNVTVPMDREAMLARIEILDGPSELAASASATLRARVVNVSEHTWSAGRLVKLGNHWCNGDVMLIQDDGRTDLPCDVGPGDAVDLELLVTAPAVPGPYELELDMLQEFIAWWADVGSQPARMRVKVTADTNGAGSERAGEIVADSPPVAPPADVSSTMEMHGLHTNLVQSLFAHCGSKVLAAVPDTLAGPEWESFTYVVRRVT